MRPRLVQLTSVSSLTLQGLPEESPDNTPIMGLGDAWTPAGETGRGSNHYILTISAPTEGGGFDCV